MDKIPIELVNKIIMMQIPYYPYLWELQLTRVIVFDCNCASCCSYHNFACGCINLEFNKKDAGKFGQILCLNWRDVDDIMLFLPQGIRDLF